MTVRSLGPLGLAGTAAVGRRPRSRPGTATVRLPQAPALTAGPPAPARRALGRAHPRPGHRVRLAARLRRGRRRPLASTGGPRPGASTSSCAPGSPSATGASSSCWTPPAPRPAGSATCRGSTPRWTPPCCSPPWPPAPATGSTWSGRRPRGARAGSSAATGRRCCVTSSGHGAARARPVEADWPTCWPPRSSRLSRRAALVVLLTALEPSAVEESLLPTLADARRPAPGRHRLGRRPRALARCAARSTTRRGIRRRRGRAHRGAARAHRDMPEPARRDVIDAEPRRAAVAAGRPLPLLKAAGCSDWP